MPFRILAGAAAFAVLSGCATPHVVDEIKISDRDLNCGALLREIDIAAKYGREAEDERDPATGGMLLNGILFPPMLVLLPATIALDSASDSNIEEAKSASYKRRRHLQNLYKKKCAEKASAAE